MSLAAILRQVGACLLCLFASRANEAAGHRLALIGADPELARSVSIALTPWGVALLTTSVDSPGSSLPEAAERASNLARQLDVDAVVWVSVSERGSILWVYDTQNDEISTRVFTETPPLSPSAAAAVALSLKTLLRATVVAPESERFGAATPDAPSPERFQLESGGGVRVLAAQKAEVRVAIGTLFWFRPPPRGIGAALEFSLGRGVAVENEEFVGRFRELDLSPMLRWQVLAGGRAASSLFAGMTGHFTMLDGSLASGASTTTQRFNVSFDVGARADFDPSRRVHLGIVVKASYLSAYQRYLVRDHSVFELWPVTAEVGGRIGVDLF